MAGKFCICRDDAHFLLAGEGFFTVGIPTIIELAFILIRPFLADMMRGVHGAGQKYMKKGLLGATCLASAMKLMALSTRSSVRW